MDAIFQTVLKRLFSFLKNSNNLDTRGSTKLKYI